DRQLGLGFTAQRRAFTRVKRVLVLHGIEHAAFEVLTAKRVDVGCSVGIGGSHRARTLSEKLFEDARGAALGTFTRTAVVVPVASVLRDRACAKPHADRLRTD